MRQMKPLLEKGYRFEILPPGALSRPCPFCGGEELGLELHREAEEYLCEELSSETTIIASARVKCNYCGASGPSLAFQCRNDCEGAVKCFSEAIAAWDSSDFDYESQIKRMIEDACRGRKGKMEAPE